MNDREVLEVAGIEASLLLVLNRLILILALALLGQPDHLLPLCEELEAEGLVHRLAQTIMRENVLL